MDLAARPVLWEDLAARPVLWEDLGLDWLEIPIMEAKVLVVSKEVLEVNMEEEVKRLAEKKVVMEESEHEIIVCD